MGAQPWRGPLGATALLWALLGSISHPLFLAQVAVVPTRRDRHRSTATQRRDRGNVPGKGGGQGGSGAAHTGYRPTSHGSAQEMVEAEEEEEDAVTVAPGAPAEDGEELAELRQRPGASER